MRSKEIMNSEKYDELRNLNLKCETVQQFKLLTHVKENFIPEAKVKVELLQNNKIQITDESGENCILTLTNDKIDEEFHMSR